MGHKGPTTSARFSPDRQRVVTASADHTARLWDAVTGKAIGEPMKHDEGVTSAQFSADGQQVLTASADGTARLWDVPTIGRENTAEALLLFADLAEARGGVALQTRARCRFQLIRRPNHFCRDFFQLNRDWNRVFQLNRRLFAAPFSQCQERGFFI